MPRLVIGTAVLECSFGTATAELQARAIVFARWRSGLVALVLAARALDAHAADVARDVPSFVRAPFVHPLVVRELAPGLLDPGEQIVAIDAVGAASARNRFSGNFTVHEASGAPRVVWSGEVRPGARAAFYSYQFLGTLDARVTVLRVARGTGGTGVFETLLLVTMDEDVALTYDATRHELRTDRKRLLLRLMAEIPLGDRYSGVVAVRGDEIVIPADGGPLSSQNGRQREEVVRMKTGAGAFR
jgi:hypothetical protein